MYSTDSEFCYAMRNKALRDQYMRAGKGFMLVYSITDKNSLKELNTFREQILRVKDVDHAPMVMYVASNTMITYCQSFFFI